VQWTMRNGETRLTTIVDSTLASRWTFDDYKKDLYVPAFGLLGVWRDLQKSSEEREGRSREEGRGVVVGKKDRRTESTRSLQQFGSYELSPECSGAPYAHH